MFSRTMRLPRFLTAGALALGLAMTTLPGAAQDAGNPARADVMLKTGSKTLFLELVNDQAIVSFAPGATGGPSVLDKFATVGRTASGYSQIAADANSAVAKDAKASGLSLADYLVGQEDIAFAGPVFKLGDRVLGVADRVIVQFDSGASAAAKSSVLAQHGLTTVIDFGNGAVCAKLDTNDGQDTLAAVEALSADPAVKVADVDWLFEVALDNVTPSFGGTSSAAPVVSGLVALVRFIAPDLSRTEVMQLIRDSALPIPGAEPPPEGEENQLGSGIVNAARAVALAIDKVNGDGDGDIDDGDVIPATPEGIASFEATLLGGDPLFAYQWHLSAGTNPDVSEDADIDLPEALALMVANGFSPITSPPIVGLVDDGVAFDHDDLNVLTGFDAARDADPSGGGAPRDAQPRSAGTHGTSVAGVMAGIMGNGIAGVGVAPGFPTVGIRLITDDVNLVFGSALVNAFVFAGNQGVSVLNNSWGINGRPSDAPLTASEQLALQVAIDADMVVVFSAGNEAGAVSGMNGSGEVLTVISTTNQAQVAGYSNTGGSVDVAAPSNGGTLGIVTTSLDFMALGGNNPRFNPLDVDSFGGVNTMGIVDWSEFIRDRFFRLVSRTITRDGTTVTTEELYTNTPGRGIVFPTDAGQLELTPTSLLFDPATGNITGTMTLRVRSATGVVTQTFNVPVFVGRTRSMRIGIARERENGMTQLLLLGRGMAGGQNVNYLVQGFERYQTMLNDDDEYVYQFRTFNDSVPNVAGENPIPRFQVRSTASIQGAGLRRTEGVFLRKFPETDVDDGKPILGNATMYLTSQALLRPTLPGFVRGGASVDFTGGSLNAGGRGMALVTYSLPGRIGRATAMLSNGRWRGMSSGFHTADVGQASVDLANLTFFPERIMFFTPSTLTIVSSKDKPPVDAQPGVFPEVAVRDNATNANVADNTGVVDFGEVLRGGATATRTFTVSNSGSGTLTITGLTAPPGFRITEGLPATITPGSSDTFTVELLTATAGVVTGRVQFGTNDIDENPFSFTVTGLVVGPEVAVSRDGGINVSDGGSVNAGTAMVGQTTPLTKTFTVRNLGTAAEGSTSGDLRVETVMVSGPFSVMEQLTGPIVPGGEETFTIQFDPTAAGTFSGTVSFTTNDPDENPFNFTINATATSGLIVMDGATALVDGSGPVDFGSAITGGTLTKQFTVTNPPSATTSLTTFGLTATAPFRVIEGLSSPIAPGESDTFTIEFRSFTAGTFNGVVQFNYSGSNNNPFNFTVRGSAHF